MIAFTRRQSALIGDRLAQPGHNFPSGRGVAGIGLSADAMVMLSPRDYERYCAEPDARLGAAFGGLIIHSCGNWGRWLPGVMKLPGLRMVDGAFSIEGDPNPNDPEVFRRALAGTGVALQMRSSRSPDEILTYVRRTWTPGMKMVVYLSEPDPDLQRRLYTEIHAICQ
jgi:hypothetical protein